MVNSELIKSMQIITDPGVEVTHDNKMTAQVEKICLKARSREAMLLRNFSHLPLSKVALLFTTTHPLLEYASCFWNPT